MRAAARRNELDDLHGHRVDDRDSHRALISDVEDGSVGRQLDVDRQAADVDIANKPHLVDVDLGDDARVLGRDHEVASVGAEVHVVGARPRNSHRPEELPAVPPVAKLDALLTLHDVDRLGAVRREVEVVRVRDADRRRRLARVDVEHRQAARALVVHVQRAHVPGGRDVVRNLTDTEVVDDLVGDRVDHVDGPGAAVGNVDALRDLAQRARDDARHRVRVNVEGRRGKGRRLHVRWREQPRGLLVGRRRVDRRSCQDNARDHGGGAQDHDHEDPGEEDP